MKKYFLLLLVMFSLVTVKAQISLKVKKTTSGSEVDLKTNGKSGTTGTTAPKNGSAGSKTTEQDTRNTTAADTVANQPLMMAITDQLKYN